MCQTAYLYRVSILFLLCALMASIMGTSAPEMEKSRPCQIGSIKHLEKNIAVERRETCRLEYHLILKRILAPASITCSDALSHHFQPYLIDRSYKRCNLSILASKHHPPTS